MTHTITQKKTSLRNTLSGIGTALLMAFIVISISLISPYLKDIASTVNTRVNLALVSVSSIFKSAPKIALESDLYNVESGDVFSLAWKMSNDSKGTSSLSYPCIAGSSLSLVMEDNSKQPISCEKSIQILSTKNVVSLVAETSLNQYTDLPITVEFRDGEFATEASVLITVNNPKIKFDPKANAVSPVTLPTQNTPTKVVIPVVKETQVASPTSSNPAKPNSEIASGPKQDKIYPISNTPVVTADKNSDLAVKILEIGFIDKNTNTFISTTTLKAGDRIAVRFEIQNIGGRATGDWRFNAVLPTYPSYIFSSDGQQSLFPGDKIEFTIGFDHIEKADNNTVVINADPASSINELSEENNIAKTIINGVRF